MNLKEKTHSMRVVRIKSIFESSYRNRLLMFVGRKKKSYTILEATIRAKYKLIIEQFSGNLKITVLWNLKTEVSAIYGQVIYYPQKSSTNDVSKFLSYVTHMSQFSHYFSRMSWMVQIDLYLLHNYISYTSTYHGGYRT